MKGITKKGKEEKTKTRVISIRFSEDELKDLENLEKLILKQKATDFYGGRSKIIKEAIRTYKERRESIIRDFENRYGQREQEYIYYYLKKNKPQSK